MSKITSEILYRRTIPMSKVMISTAFSMLLFGIAMYIYLGITGNSKFEYFFVVLHAIGGIYFFINILFSPNIIITAEHLIFHYPYLFRKKAILWTAITDANMEYFDTNYDNEYMNYRKGKAITLFANSKKYHIILFLTLEDEKLFYQINKQLGGRFKSKMKREYKESVAENEKKEAAYPKYAFKIIFRLFIIGFVVFWILKKWFV